MRLFGCGLERRGKGVGLFVEMKEGIGAMCEAFGVGFVKVGVVDRHVSSRRRVSECGCDRRGRWPVAVRMGSASVSRLESNASADKPVSDCGGS